MKGLGATDWDSSSTYLLTYLSVLRSLQGVDWVRMSESVSYIPNPQSSISKSRSVSSRVFDVERVFDALDTTLYD